MVRNIGAYPSKVLGNAQSAVAPNMKERMPRLRYARTVGMKDIGMSCVHSFKFRSLVETLLLLHRMRTFIAAMFYVNAPDII